MITLEEFQKRMKSAWATDDDVKERLMVIESTIEEILEEMNKC